MADLAVATPNSSPVLFEEDSDEALDTEPACDAVAVNPEYLVKHPLHCVWGLWYFKNEKGKDWQLNQKIIIKFDTVEDFWALYNYIVPASRLSVGCDYSMFKEGIKPMWEDMHNKEGGRWLVNLDRSQRTNKLDQYWQELLLCMIGEAFDERTDDICGAVVNIRPKVDKLALWTKDATKEAHNIQIGRTLKTRLSIDQKIDFLPHEDINSSSNTSSKTRVLFTV